MTIVASPPTDSRVGLRQFRAQLSDYVDAVKTGRTFVLTEHGVAVAQLIPMEGLSTYERLLAEGVILQASRRYQGLDAPVKAQGIVSDLITEQRR